MKVYIMRGLPGSGKTRWVQSRVGYQTVASADHYFQKDGEYRFDASKLAEAHQECLRAFLRSVEHGALTIIVDNTNIRAWEMSPYIAIAEAFGYDVEIVEVRTSVDTCIARNAHEVSEETIWKMFRTMCDERLPPWWKRTVVASDV